MTVRPRLLFQEILQAPSERLGLFRALVGAYLFIYLLVQSPLAWQTMNADAATFEPVGLLSLLQLSRAPTLPLALTLYLAAIVSAGFFATGAHFRFSGPLTALAVLWVSSYKSSFGMLFHSENLVTLQTLLIGFAPAARSFSYDRYRAPTSIERKGDSGWPLLFCALVAIGAYVLAGIAKWKLSGMDWATGDVLRIQVAYDNLRKIELGSIHSPIGAWTVSHAWLFPPLGAMTLLAELGGPLALLHRRIALGWVLLVVGFHWGVLLLMAITFSYPLVGVPFLCLFPLENTNLGRRAFARFAALRD